MTASDYLGPQFYHGTGRYIPGEMVEAGHPQSNAVPTHLESPHDRSAYFSGSYSYASTDPDVAMDHAIEADVPSHKEDRQVLRVSPVGIPRRDPEDDQLHPTSFMSRQGWKIEPHDETTRRLNKSLRDY